MRLIVQDGPGRLGYNHMWGPAFISYDPHLKSALEKSLAEKLVGRPLNDETLDYAHELAVDFICEYHKAIPGLRDYIDAIKFVQDGG